MAAFQWKGRDAQGHVIQGELVAPSKEEVVRRLRGQHITVTSITERGGRSGEPLDPDRGAARVPGESSPFRAILIVIGIIAVILLVIELAR